MMRATLRLPLLSLLSLLSVGALASVSMSGCSATPSADGPDAAAAPDSSAQETSAPKPGVLALEPGEAAELVVEEGRASVRLASTGVESYVAIVASTKLDTSKGDHAYSAAQGPAEGAKEAKRLDGCALRPDAWKGKAVPTETGPTGTPPAVGTTRTLKVPVGTRLETITAEVLSVSEKAVVWIDKTPAHPATLDAAFVAEFLADFDKNILPRSRTIFGIESDADADGRVGLVFTPLTKDSAVAFFRQCDLFEGTGCGVDSGNKGEFLYLTPPADIAPPYNTPAAIKEILAHELGHLLHFNRKVVRNKLSDWPDASYMIEGFGGFAQDASGYQSGNLYVTMAGLEGIGDFSLSEVVGTRSTYDTKRDGLLRGVSYLFVRYLYDRAGGDTAKEDGTIEGRGGPAFLRDVLDAKESVAQKTVASAGTTLADVAMDFYTALALSNSEKGSGTAPKSSCFSFGPVETDPLTKKPRGADVFASFHGQKMKGPKMQPLAAADGKVRSGGVEYLSFAAAPSSRETALEVSVDAAALPRVRVVRLK